MDNIFPTTSPFYGRNKSSTPQHTQTRAQKWRPENKHSMLGSNRSIGPRSLQCFQYAIHITLEGFLGQYSPGIILTPETTGKNNYNNPQTIEHSRTVTYAIMIGWINSFFERLECQILQSSQSHHPPLWPWSKRQRTGNSGSKPSRPRHHDALPASNSQVEVPRCHRNFAGNWGACIEDHMAV